MTLSIVHISFTLQALITAQNCLSLPLLSQVAPSLLLTAQPHPPSFYPALSQSVSDHYHTPSDYTNGTVHPHTDILYTYCTHTIATYAAMPADGCNIAINFLLRLSCQQH